MEIESDTPPFAAPSRIIDSPGPGLAAPGFVIGEVILRDREFIYLKTGGGDRILRVGASARIWKGGVASLGDVQPGDELTVSGELLGDGSIDARIVDVNVGQVRGFVDHVPRSGQWVVRDIRGGRQTVVVDSSNPPVEVHATSGESIDRPPVGKGVMVIGVKLSDGSLRATRIYFSAGQ